MNAKDLMIGDWVLYDGEPNMITEVSEIIHEEATVCFVGNNYMANIDEIEPIPLTPEILEKNGFVIKKKWAQRGNFGDSPLIMWHFEDDAVLGDYKHELEVHQNDTGKVHVHIPCEYVHELQHALRMCGITKEIEL